MKHIKLFSILAILTLAVACGGSPAKTAAPKQPLDPQGNWLFTLTGSEGSTAVQFAGQLFELTSPVVTSNEMPTFGTACSGAAVSGQASGTNTINLTATVDGSLALSGTIADSQQAMSGTWSGISNCFGPTLGTWAAQELAPVTNTWSGTASNSAAITAVLSENTDQTAVNFGEVSGTVTISENCFTGPVSATGGHIGESLTLNSTQADSNGATLSVTGTVDPTATTITGNFTVAGGPCDGETFTASLTHN